MELQTIYEDDKLLVVDKPAGLSVWNEGIGREETVADLLLGQFPELEKLGEERRYGIVHRLDKDTSGILLVSKTKQEFEQLQKQFAERKVEKQYICLVEGSFNQENGIVHTLLGRSPADRRKQKAFSLDEQKIGRHFDKDPLHEGRSSREQSRRQAITEWKVLGK